jgi:translation initiation factor RLI1
MTVYNELLEKYLFEETRIYFEQYANDSFKNVDADAYVNSISKAIKKEEDNADYLL